MARIIYGVQSDGLGHYSRSRLVIDHLVRQGHEVKVATSHRPYELMKSDYDVEKMDRINFFYKNNRVNYTRTIYENFIRNPNYLRKGIRKAKKMVDEFRPELVITDMEIFSTKAAVSRGIPVITIDNIHSLARTDASRCVKKKFKILEAEQKSFLKILSPRSRHMKRHIITSFFNPRPTRKKTTVIPPLIRECIIESKGTEERDHVFVYQTSRTNKDLFPSLRANENQKFIIYGFDKDAVEGNLEFRKTDTGSRFLNDLASAKAVITNGGFSLISEAIFLGKPVLSNPIAGQYEQIINASHVERLGYGKFEERISAENVRDFLEKIGKYRSRLKRYEQQDNSEALGKIDEIIEELLNKD